MWWRIALVVVVCAVLVRLAFQTGALTLALDEQVPCPPSPRHTHPYLFHFVPGLEQHQSWIEALVPEPDATQFVLCVDGNLMATGIGETPDHGIVDVSVRTTWVDAEWLLGALDLFSVPERWDLGYTTYGIMQRPG
jgi:hypothetical protein